MLLSCRRVVFTRAQTCFQCMVSTSIESLSPGTSFDSASTLATGFAVRSVRFNSRNFPIEVGFEELYGVFPHHSIGGRTYRLSDRLCEYYKRQLSFVTDSIDAFLGIINFYSAMNSTEPNVSQFYGVLFSYGKALRSGLPRESFLDQLLWSIRWNRVTPRELTHTFPSWSWASVKASQPVNALGDLMPSTVWTDDYNMYRDIEVRVQHEHDGIFEIADLPYQKDSYKHFMPWIDITTWTRPCRVSRRHIPFGEVALYYRKVRIYDPLALEKAEVHAVCLKASALIVNENAVSVSGLLVVETEPELYRRVATFSWEISFFPDYKLSKEFRNELRALKVSRGCTVSKKRLEKGGWTGPQILGRLSDNPWQRRTMRLI
jgi:hypothetical protein